MKHTAFALHTCCCPWFSSQSADWIQKVTSLIVYLTDMFLHSKSGERTKCLCARWRREKRARSWWTLEITWQHLGIKANPEETCNDPQTRLSPNSLCLGSPAPARLQGIQAQDRTLLYWLHFMNTQKSYQISDMKHSEWWTKCRHSRGRGPGVTIQREFFLTTSGYPKLQFVELACPH